MMQQIDITYSKGADIYLVTITRKNLRDVFATANGHQDLEGKEGEALVKAIVACGGISKIERRKNGKYNDGPHGEPGLIEFNTNGTPRAIRHFKDGKLKDVVNGDIAVLQFDHNGSRLVYGRSFENDKRRRLSERELTAYQVLLNKKFRTKHRSHSAIPTLAPKV